MNVKRFVTGKISMSHDCSSDLNVHLRSVEWFMS